jgi:PAS domain S-box-containing protein
MAKGIRILHLDDDYSFLTISREILLDMNKSIGDIDFANSPNEALTKLAANNYDVILSDYEMPEKNGLDFLKLLKQKKIRIPFILFTGKGREEVAIKALNLGADGYFNKQGDPETVYGELVHGIKSIIDKNMAKHECEESENRYRILLENISDAIVVHDNLGNIFDINKQACDSLGYSEEEVLQTNISKFGTLDSDVRLKYWNKALAGEIVKFESNLKRKDNSTFPVAISLRKVLLGKRDLILASIRDVSEEKNAESERAQKYQVLERITECLDSGLAIISKDYRVIWANEVLRKRYDISNKKCYQTFNRLDHPCPDCGAKKIFEQNVKLDVHEYEALVSKEDPHWVEIRATPLKNKNGEVTSAIELTVTITERKKIENRIKSIYQSVPDPMYVWQAVYGDFVLIDYNESAVQITDGAVHQFKGILASKLYGVESEIFNELKLCFDKKNSFTREMPYHYSVSNKEKYLNVKYAFVTPDLVLVYTEDITERKKADEVIRRSNKDLEIINEKLQVVGGMTRHDIGNMLTNAKLNMFLLKKSLKNDPQLAVYIESIEKCFDQSAKILEFSRIYEQIGVEKLKAVNVAAQFDEASALIPHGKVKIINQAQGLSVLADSMLQQLFYNLIDNSLRHGKTVTKIKLSFKETLKAIQLIYEDNGIGISLENKNKIFTNGFTTGGSGIGLKLIKRMIEVYGWIITEEGKEGKNAKFVITIPTSVCSIKNFTD